MGKETLEFEEENLDLVAVDAEMIKTIVRTQGEIIGHLLNIDVALLGLVANMGMVGGMMNKLCDEITKICNTNTKLTQSLENYTMATLEEKK